jgi:CRISPR/Cas system CSM-associated protein Csm2 small subunit
MSKKSSVVNEVEYKSLRDLGYSVAKKSDAVKLDGKFAVEHIAGFPDAILPEARLELNEGFRLRASELPKYQPVEYSVVDGNYIPSAQLSEQVAERYTVSVASAFSYTQQQFGAMKNENPQLYLIVQDLRNRVNKYSSGCMSDLMSAARKYLKELNPETKTRAATLAYVDYLQKVLDEMITRCKTAESRGNDDTANLARLNEAIIAFKVKYMK